MSDAMSSYWTNMAASGDPSVGPQGVPLHWPPYTNASDVNIQVRVLGRENEEVATFLKWASDFLPLHPRVQFALPFNTTVHLKQSRCDMWDSVIAALNANGGVVNR
jgi:hypothetical protein